ncbi:MAG: cadherin-like beta sandwich domain-containing protein [Acidimicrobiia bacterium]|nr:cadherin-like beta sandwich domain-containing protein [Acidimicrobiia bacterium]
MHNGGNVNGLVLSPSVSGFNFAQDTFSYRILVPHYVTRLRTVPVANDPNANVAVDGVPVASGTLSGFKELSVGSNQLVVTVVAEDGSLSETYSLTVVRGTNNGPVFDEGSNIVRTVTEKVWDQHRWSGRKLYRPVYLQKPILADRITATDPDGDRIVYGLKDNDDKIFAIDENTGELYVNRVPKSYPLGDFETEPNTATVTVTALDPTGSGVATETTVTINIADSGTDLSLKSIEFSDFSLIRGFRSDVTHHVTVVPYETTQTTLTAEPTDPEAWLRLVAYNIDVYGNKLVRSTDRDAPCSTYHCVSFFQEPIPSGVPSIVLPLDVGINRIELGVNIADRLPPPAPLTDSQSYYFTIIRENPPSKPPIELYSSLFSNYRSNDNTIDAVRSVPEKSPAGTPVGARLATTDPYGTLVRYPVYYDFAYSSKFPRKNRTKFDINNETGQITVAKNANLDHQTEPVIKIEITAYDWKTRDAQGDLVPYFLFPMATITVTINITPSNDPPPRNDPPPPRNNPPPRDDPPPPRNNPPPPGDPPPKDDGTRVAITERPVTLTEIRNAVYDYNNGRVTLETLLKLLAQFHNRLR